MDRRSFLAGIGQISAASAALSTLGISPISEVEAAPSVLRNTNPGSAERRVKALQIRQQAATNAFRAPIALHAINGDEEYSSKFASFTKTLPHNALGEVDLAAYDVYSNAFQTGNPADFDLIPSGGPVKLANPQAAFAFALEGRDSFVLDIPAPPAFSSEESAGEMAELYWHGLTRDIPFSQYGAEPITQAAITDLKRFSYFSGVNAGNVFRGETAGDRVGPYLSQFLVLDIPYGANSIVQRSRTPAPGTALLTSYDEWLSCQNGMAPTRGAPMATDPHYLRNARDLAEWVHRDFSSQGFLSAALIALTYGGAALDDANPYKTNTRQGAFVTFGGPYILDLVTKVTQYALKAVWCQKWMLHRKLRPETFGGRIHNQLTGAATYPIHEKLLNSSVLDQIISQQGTYLLPQAFPEGSPTHPSFPAGHAAIGGACATVLKAFFKESFVLPNPMVATDDGQMLTHWAGESLTLGGELNKLAANISLGRDMAGIHYRSDGIDGMALGEKVAIALLQELRATYNEAFAGFTLTKFDGSTITL